MTVWDVVWWETNKSTSFLFTQTFQKLKKIKATKLSTLFQNHHSFLVSKIDVCCLRFNFDGTVSQSCLVEVNYLLLVNECTWVILHVVVVLSELYPKAKTELIVEISRMKKSQINVVLSKPCWNVRWLYLTLKTSFWNFFNFEKSPIADCNFRLSKFTFSTYFLN